MTAQLVYPILGFGLFFGGAYSAQRRWGPSLLAHCLSSNAPAPSPISAVGAYLNCWPLGSESEHGGLNRFSCLDLCSVWACWGGAGFCTCFGTLAYKNLKIRH